MKNATRNAKTEKSAQNKAMMVVRKYTTDRTKTTGRFKDPAARS